MSRHVQALLVPALILAFCLVYAYRNRAVPAQDMMLVTPITVLIVVLVLLDALRSVRHGPVGDLSWNELRRPIFLVVLVALFVYVAHYDFIIAGIAFTAAALLLLGERRPPIILGNALLTPPLLFYLFNNVMGVPLKSALWG